MQQGPVIEAQERKKKEQEARRNREKARNTKDPRPDQEDPRSVQRLGLDRNHCFPLSKQMAPDPSEFIALNNPHWRQWYILYYMYNYVYILTYSIIFTKSQCLTRVDLIFLRHVAMAMLWPRYGHAMAMLWPCSVQEKSGCNAGARSRLGPGQPGVSSPVAGACWS